MQNKPNFFEPCFVINTFPLKTNDQKTPSRLAQNKPNSKPIQTQTNPISDLNSIIHSQKSYSGLFYAVWPKFWLKMDVIGEDLRLQSWVQRQLTNICIFKREVKMKLVTTISIVAVIVCFTGSIFAAPGEISFFAGEKFDAKIPTPESVVGHSVEEGAVGYESLIRYLEALAEASERVIMTPYGKTHEGRTLFENPGRQYEAGRSAEAEKC
jgi:hypothetical protein